MVRGYYYCYPVRGYYYYYTRSEFQTRFWGPCRKSACSTPHFLTELSHKLQNKGVKGAFQQQNWRSLECTVYCRVHIYSSLSVSTPTPPETRFRIIILYKLRVSYPAQPRVSVTILWKSGQTRTIRIDADLEFHENFNFTRTWYPELKISKWTDHFASVFATNTVLFRAALQSPGGGGYQPLIKGQRDFHTVWKDV